MGLLRKRVFEDPADYFERWCRNVHRDVCALPVVEGPNIVQTEDMVGVGVGVNDGIQVIDAGTENLRSEIRRRIDNDVVVPVLQQDGWPQAVVPRVC